MDNVTAKPNLLRAQDIAAQQQGPFNHPMNPQSAVYGTLLAKATGMARVGISHVRIPPGKESFCYHSHYREEEFIYILSGQGNAEIDGAEYAVGPGDFMGFPTPSVAHHLRNTGDEDLVYLMGGESQEFEIADFPREGKRMVRRGAEIDIFPLSAREDFSFG